MRCASPSGVSSPRHRELRRRLERYREAGKPRASPGAAQHPPAARGTWCRPQGKVAPARQLQRDPQHKGSARPSARPPRTPVLRVSSEDTVESENGSVSACSSTCGSRSSGPTRKTGSASLVGARGEATVVWIVSVQSRIAANPLDAPVAIFEEDREQPPSPRLEDVEDRHRGRRGGVALAAEGKNREGRLVTMSAMSPTGSLKDFTDAAPRRRVVGFGRSRPPR